MPENTLTVVDNRTGKSYTIPITNETIRAMDFRQIKVNPDDFGMMTYDPAFTNTACCESTDHLIDGDKGILRYRGYDIEELAENCTFLQVAYLLINGELPDSGAGSRLDATRSTTACRSSRTSRSSWKGSATTRIPWACW